LEENIKTSFAGVRSDTDTLWQWVQYLQSQNDEMRRSLDDNTAAVKQLPTAEIVRQEVQEAIDKSDVFSQLMDRIRHVEHRVDRLAHVEQRISVIEGSQKDVFSRLKELHSHVSEVGNLRRQNVIPRTVSGPSQTITPLQEKAVKLAARNSKELIKQSIRKLIRLHGKISGVALRESIVSEQGLCSKSSFYRILEEMEDTDDITVSQDGKEKTYFWGSSSITRQH